MMNTAFILSVCHAIFYQAMTTKPACVDDGTDEEGLLQLQLSSRNGVRTSSFRTAVQIQRSLDGGELKGDKFGTLAGTEAAVNNLAQHVVQGNVGLNETELLAVEGIKDTMTTMIITSIEEEHKQEQIRVDAARAAFDNCKTTSNHSEGLKADADLQGDANTVCRGDQAGKNQSKIQLCKSYTDSVMGQPAPPPCMKNYATLTDVDTIHDCLRDITNWSYSLNSTLAPLEEACDGATLTLQGKVTTCDQTQRHFEQAVCNYKSAKDEVCTGYDDCRSAAINSRSSVHAQVAVAEAGLKAAFTASHRILCYLDIFNLTAAEQPEKLQNCSKEVHNTSELNITYHEVPQERDCDAGLYPCLDAWLTQNYYNNTWHMQAPPLACIACDTMTTTTTTTTTTSTP